ncbi:ABC transporter ATP-binding protein [Sulfurimonas sp.]|uniref:ABC transporter ATP-binding protein n=1 Tax=Sulfurimonas sp. TaxID=2022749 RepID=UPI003561820F
MIELKNVEKYFYKGEEREVHALNDVNLKIEDGEFSVLTGTSGCGKTTLLNAVGLLDNITSGEIYLDGNELAHLSDEEKTKIRLEKMGFVFQAYNLIPVLSVKENIAFIMRLQGYDSKQIDKRVDELAELLEIKSKLDSLPSLLSGGQQQRVAVARAVATKPKIILADEPTANLDHKNSEALMKMMKELNEKEKITILFASHDDYVVELAKKVIHLKDGKVL